MEFFLLFMSISFLVPTFLLFFYFDIKFRKIPNNISIFLIVLSLIFNIFEFTLYSQSILTFMILRFFFFFLKFFLSFFFFCLKIIGGSDGKLILLIIITNPLKFLNTHLVFSFFLIFSSFFLIFFFFTVIQNSCCKEKESFAILFYSVNDFSIFKRLYLKGFFRFLDYINLPESQSEKNPIKSLFIIYNNEKRRTQLLIQIRPPLTSLVIVSYFTLYFLMLAV